MKEIKLKSIYYNPEKTHPWHYVFEFNDTEENSLFVMDVDEFIKVEIFTDAKKFFKIYLSYIKNLMYNRNINQHLYN